MAGASAELGWGAFPLPSPVSPQPSPSSQPSVSELDHNSYQGISHPTYSQRPRAKGLSVKSHISGEATGLDDGKLTKTDFLTPGKFHAKLVMLAICGPVATSGTEQRANRRGLCSQGSSSVGGGQTLKDLVNECVRTTHGKSCGKEKRRWGTEEEKWGLSVVGEGTRVSEGLWG